MAQSGSGIMMPSGGGGLMRYSEEYPSRFKLSPAHVVVVIIAVVLSMAILKLFF